MKTIVNYLSQLFDGLAKGLFVSLIVGLIVEQLAYAFDLTDLAFAGKIAQYSMGAAVGVAIAKIFNYQKVTTATAAVVGFIGSGAITASGIGVGDPLTTAITCAVVLPIINKLERNKIFDIITIPLIAIILSYFVFKYSQPISSFVFDIGQTINNSVDNSPIISTSLIAALISVAISGPISSAALSIVLGLNGKIAFAALCATSAQMSGFFTMTLKANGFKNSLLILLGSSKLLLKNIVKKPLVFIPPLIASIITAILGVLLTDLVSVKEAGGMGNLGFVGQLLTLDANGYTTQNIILLVIFCFIIPVAITYPIYLLFKKRGIISDSDLII